MTGSELYITKRKGKRHLTYGNKRWEIQSKIKSDTILRRLDRILRALEKKKRRTYKRRYKKPINESKNPESIAKVHEKELEKAVISLIPNLIKNPKPAGYLPPPPPPEPTPDTNKEAINELQTTVQNLAKVANERLEKVEEDVEQKIQPLPVKGFFSTGKKVGRPKKPHTLPKTNEIAERDSEDSFKLPPINDSAMGRISSTLRTMSPTRKPNPASSSSGAGAGEGLTNHQLNSLARKYPNYLGTLSIDQLNVIPELIKNLTNFQFIMNTADFPNDGHWVAVKGDKHTLEYYDSFGEPPSKEFLNEMTKIMKDWSDELIQLKINTVKKQRVNSNRCGWHALLFLKKRNKGESFSEATGFKSLSQVSRGEREARKFEKKHKDFDMV